MEEGDETKPIVTNFHDPFNAVSINKLRAPTDYQLIDEIDQFMGIWFGSRTLRASLSRLDQQAFGNMRPANNEINETTRNAETLLDSWLPDNFKAWVDFIYPVALTTVVSPNGTNEDALDRELAFPSYVLSQGNPTLRRLIILICIHNSPAHNLPSDILYVLLALCAGGTHNGQFCLKIARREMYNDQFPDLACHLHHLNEGINHQECRSNLTHHDYEQQCAGQRIFGFTEQEQQLILNSENGVIMCGDCGSLETWGESGPHNAPGIRQQCKNQHQIVSSDHEIFSRHHILRRGTGWKTQRREGFDPPTTNQWFINPYSNEIRHNPQCTHTQSLDNYEWPMVDPHQSINIGRDPIPNNEIRLHNNFSQTSRPNSSYLLPKANHFLVVQLNEIKIEEYLLPRSGMRLGADHLPHFIFTTW
ncbi:17802_t:CDS:2, partial [Racocetra persica]